MNLQEELKDKTCYNPACGKSLTEEDAAFGTMIFPKHLCNDCFAAFDSQKMRGRFAMIGLDAGAVKNQIETQYNTKVFHAEEDPDEKRYTESVDEWIGWQMKKEKSHEG